MWRSCTFRGALCRRHHNGQTDMSGTPAHLARRATNMLRGVIRMRSVSDSWTYSVVLNSERPNGSRFTFLGTSPMS